MKLQTSLYLGRNNYPVRPKSAQIFFFHEERFKELHLSSLLALATQEKKSHLK